MALIIPDDDHSKIEQTTLMQDQLYLCATDSLLQTYYGKDMELIKEKAKSGADLKDFSKLPFCILNNRIGKNIDRFFVESGFNPKVYTRSSHFQISNLMCFRGLAAAFATRTSLHNLRGNVPDDINIFPLNHNGQPMYQETAIIRHKDRYFCHYNQYFFDLITCYHQRLEQLTTEQLISTGLKDYYPL